MFYIREFNEEDLSEVYEIALRNLTERYQPDLLLDIYQSWPSGFLVAITSMIVGFIAGTREEKTARILMLAVDREFRGQGIGSALLNHFTTNCRSEGIVSISLEVRISNQEAIQFYQNRGFQIISFTPNYYTDGEAAYVMWKML